MTDADRDRARRRHPSSQWVPDHARLRRLLADRLEAEGHPRPVLGATVLALRGVLDVGRSELAGALGVAEDELAAAEDGPDPASLRDGQVGPFAG